MTVKTLKAQLRLEAESLRASLPEQERRIRSARVCDRAIRLLEERLDDSSGSPPVLFSYVPFRTELDVEAVMAWVWERQGTVVVPKVRRRDRHMSLHAISCLDELEAGKWGIREPRPDIPVWERLSELDTMLVPGLAFDRKGGRLGYGGGYYDAFIRKYREREGKEPFKLALAFDVQIVPDVPMDRHDFRLDALVAESGLWRS